MKKALFASLLLSVFSGSVMAIDDSMRVGKNTDIQKAEELNNLDIDIIIGITNIQKEAIEAFNEFEKFIKIKNK